MRGAALSLALAAALPALALERFEAVEPAMGTLFRIVVYAGSAAEARAGFNAAFARARLLDDHLSDYREESELNRLCRAGRAAVSQDLLDVLVIARQLAQTSHGAFDPTLGPFTRLWRESRRSGRLPSAEAIAEARRRTGWRKLRPEPRTRTVTLAVPGMQLDLGGIAKGYAADQMLAELRRAGLPHALVAASGDLAIGDPPPGQPGWTIAVSGSTRVLSNRGVSTSGPSEQYVEIAAVRYAHIVDPRSGLGLVHAATAAVIAPTATLADALATAAVVLTGDKAQRLSRRWKAVCLRSTEVEQQ